MKKRQKRQKDEGGKKDENKNEELMGKLGWK